MQAQTEEHAALALGESDKAKSKGGGGMKDHDCI